MTLPRPAAFPGGRVLAGWWKQLSNWRPQALWIGSISLERVEAFCQIHHVLPLTPLDGTVLSSLNAESPVETALLDKSWGLGTALLDRLLGRLAGQGTVARSGRGWTLTEKGVRARRDRAMPSLRAERRAFWFLADLQDPQTRTFVVPSTTAFFQSVESNQIDGRSLEALRGCARKDAEWKKSRGFPLDVESVLVPEGRGPSSGRADWERIVVVHPYRVQAALISYVRSSGNLGVAAFPYQEHGWTLAPTPVFDLAVGWEEVFSRLPLTPGDDELANTWQRWLAQRGMSGPVVERYRLERQGARIFVLPPNDAPDVLGGPRSDLTRGEAWLILGEGGLRRAVLLESEPAARPAD